MSLTRRELLTTASGVAFAVAVAPRMPVAAEAQAASGPFSLPALPYPPTALEPHIDGQTMTIHHDRHHQGYVNGLNAAVAKEPSLAGRTLEALLRDLDAVPAGIRTAIQNSGGGHYNHTQFWTLMSPGAGGPPTGAAAAAITGAFGSFETFRDLFTQAAGSRFGSGWAWLSDDNGKLVVHSTANQDTPLAEGRKPIFGLDVWEHAYYLKYQNRRADYVGAFWNLINWTEVNRRLA